MAGLFPPLQTETYTGSTFDLWGVIVGLSGVWVGVKIAPFLPKRWHRSIYEYVALLVGPDAIKHFERNFIASSGSRAGDLRSARAGPLLYQYEPEDLAIGSVIEVRSGVVGDADRYQHIFRKVPNGWNLVAYRQQFVSGWSNGRPSFRRFYRWEIVTG